MENELIDLIETILPAFTVKFAAGRTLEEFIATDAGRKTIFVNFDGIDGYNQFEDQSYDGITENYRVFILDMHNIQDTARTLFNALKSNEIGVILGSGMFDNTFSQAVYVQNLAINY